MSGDNEQEAFDNLKSLIVERYEMLRQEKPENLGPEPTRQLRIVSEYICPRKSLATLVTRVKRLWSISSSQQNTGRYEFAHEHKETTPGLGGTAGLY